MRAARRIATVLTASAMMIGLFATQAAAVIDPGALLGPGAAPGVAVPAAPEVAPLALPEVAALPL
ncbi:hypothetical protein GCM10023080_069020 [Streptomyces pseudoechinosporeus]